MLCTGGMTLVYDYDGRCWTQSTLSALRVRSVGGEGGGMIPVYYHQT
jgi:hypothetical protein